MVYTLGLIILILIAVIFVLSIQMHNKDSEYQYKSHEMKDMESDYEDKINSLQSTIKDLNETAYTHTVTKIGNIDYFIDKCSSLFDRYPRSKFIMVGFSISNMGKINQIFGPSEGDKVMIYTADILKSAALTGTTYAHVNSNLFGILFKDFEDEDVLKIISDFCGDLLSETCQKAVCLFGACIGDVDRTQGLFHLAGEVLQGRRRKVNGGDGCF